MDAHRSTTAKVLAAIATVGLIPFGLAVLGSGQVDPPPSVEAAAEVSTPAYAPNWIAITTGVGAGITLNGPGTSSELPQVLASGPNCSADLGRDTARRFVTLS